MLSMLQNSPPENKAPEEGARNPGASGSIVQQGLTRLIRATLALLGAILIPIGVVIAFLTPIIPVGLPIVILGVVLLARNAVWGRRWLQSMLAKYPKLERFAPDWLLKLIFGDYHK
ncbi:MAG: hypothetical protein CMK09_06610 [Ponticaulis sp.]|nr:hypothetical protein [Ponticaulis sp.]|tara:strand:- start:29576 stop:29923 length:348 start_codon:yes stop_codon:yes gene_type:complete